MTRATEEPRFDFGQRKRIFPSPPRLGRHWTPFTLLSYDSAGGKPWGNWLGNKAHDLSASTTKVKNACCYCSILLLVHVSWCLMQFLRLLCLQHTTILKTTAPVYVELFFAYFQFTRQSAFFHSVMYILELLPHARQNYYQWKQERNKTK